jgi:hypothetical protein
MTDNKSATQKQWEIKCSQITDMMKVHTRPFITPLSKETEERVWLEGSGSYLCLAGQRVLLTCEHVSKSGALDYRFNGSENVYRVSQGIVESRSLDISYACLNDQAWNATKHQADTIPYERFAPMHRLVNPCEPVFFHGFSGENSGFAFETLTSNASAYLSQQKADVTADEKIFEVFWEPQETAFTESTTQAERATVRHDSSGGFSGSLVWNTRFLETTAQGKEWTPDDAVVTGLLRRWDTGTKTLLVLRVEHLRKWIEEMLKP